MFFSRKPLVFVRGLTLSVAIIGAAIFAVSARAADPDNFQIRTTSDLVALCSTAPAAPDYPQSIAFCHGYAVGAFAYYSAAAAANPSARFVCLPNPPPARSQAMADFLVWMKTHTNENASPAIDTVFRYLGEHYPCKK
jgi:hypothetical protein